MPKAAAVSRAHPTHPHSSSADFLQTLQGYTVTAGCVCVCVRMCDRAGSERVRGRLENMCALREHVLDRTGYEEGSVSE